MFRIYWYDKKYSSQTYVYDTLIGTKSQDYILYTFQSDDPIPYFKFKRGSDWKEYRVCASEPICSIFYDAFKIEKNNLFKEIAAPIESILSGNI